jgi:hypothetical protein
VGEVNEETEAVLIDMVVFSIRKEISRIELERNSRARGLRAVISARGGR